MDKLKLLKIIDELGTSRSYRPLTTELKDKYYKLYLSNLNAFDNKRNLNIDNVPFAKDYERIVIGDYGAYVEIKPIDLLVDLDVTIGQEWRLDKDFLEKRNLSIKYEWYEYKGKKVYLQKDTVKYADYKPGFYYISVLYFDTIDNKYKWSRVSDNGYEVSTKGDKRFSALTAKLKNGKTIEEIYQLDIKGYREFSNDWKYGKGKKPLKDITEDVLFEEYKNLWKTFFNENSELLEELAVITKDKVITDMFAHTNISQARAIAEILNQNIGEETMNENKELDMKKVLAELNELSLHRDNKAGRVSTLKWAYRNTYPRLIVYINGGDTTVTGRNNMIIAPFRYTAFNSLTGALAEIVDLPKSSEIEIDCLNPKYVDNKKTDEIVTQAIVTVGKDEHGMIYISLREDGKPSVRFNLTLQVDWNPVRLNGVNIAATEFGSKMFTKRYLTQIESVYNKLLSKLTVIKPTETFV